MAALNRPTEATYVVHDRVTVETSDREDHTFCGVMFPVKCKDNLPLNHIIINSIAVRGRLGPLTVWVSNEPQRPGVQQFRMHPNFWTKIYEKTHRPSFHTFDTLDLSSNPILMQPGQVKAIYIHSTLPGDEAIVYDDRHHTRTYDDALISILTGRAHVSRTPFGTTSIWGGRNPWRDQREFVGRVQYGAVYKLWNPTQALLFGDKFQTLARSLFLCQRRWESPMSKLPDDCIFYILNMCRWDWANDTPTDMRMLKRRRAAARKAAAAAAEARVKASASVVAEESPTSFNTNTTTATTTTTTACCARVCTKSTTDNDDENQNSDVEFHDAGEEEVDDDDDDDEQDSDGWEDGEEEEEEEEEDDDNDNDDDDDNYDDDDHDDDDDDNEEEYEGHTAPSGVFRYEDDSDDDDPNTCQNQQNRPGWFRQQFARIHVLQALTRLEDNSVVDHNA